MTALTNLLFRAESDSLDFKRDQYKFDGANDTTKSELLKDILAMANSWREECAYILIGVDAASHPVKAVGIPKNEHIDDAKLQEFVNKKTNRPIDFAYRIEDLGGLSIGVIEIPVQERPIFLKKDFGKLKRHAVHLRRGSSTTEADPDEIAQMGASASSRTSPLLELSFASPGARELLGGKLTIDPTMLNVAEGEDLPDYQGDGRRGLSSIGMRRENRDFFRDLVTNARNHAEYRRIALTLTNKGTKSAKDIRLEIQLPDPGRTWEFVREGALSFEPPSHVIEFGTFSPAVSVNLAAKIRGDEPGVDFFWNRGVWHLTFTFGLVHPGGTFWPAPEFFVSARASGSGTLVGKILADGLTSPVNCELNIAADVSKADVSVKKLLEKYSKPLRASTIE